MATLADKLRAFDAALPLEKARTIPSSWYFDAEIYEAERRRIFGGSWQMAGRSAQVAAPRRPGSASTCGGRTSTLWPRTCGPRWPRPAVRTR